MADASAYADAHAASHADPHVRLRSDREVLPVAVPAFFRAFDLKRFVALLALAMSGYQMVTGYIGEPVPEIHRPAHLLFALSILFLGRDREARTALGRRAKAVWDWALVAMLVASTSYLFLNVGYVQTRLTYMTPLTNLEMVLSVGLMVVILEAARRAIGWFLVILTLLFFAYAMFGNHLPAPFWHRGFSVERIMDLMYFTNEGLFGSPLGVTASYIFHFILFGAILVASGAGDFFTNSANALTGRLVGGPAKTSVVSSAFMATLSGTAAANVVTTGSFTIPAMKRAGYKPEFAAGVEAVASSGGLLTPPVMGATAFVMAEMTGISYVDICIAAILPAVLYYVATYATVDLEARKLRLRPMEQADIPKLWPVFKQRGYLLVPLFALVYFLVEGYTPVVGAIWSIFSLVFLLVLLDPENRRRILQVLWAACTEAPRMMGQIAVAVSIGGILVGIITMTGIGVRLSAVILDVAHGNLFFILVLTMIFSIILGTGMPATGAYIVLALLLAPGMVALGVPLLAAHMFIFYGGCKSNITPPVAIAAFAAAAIAGTKPMRTAFVSFRIGLSVFILPFLFVYSPELLGLTDSIADMAWRFFTAGMGVTALSVACVGWLLVPLGWPERALAAACAVTFIFPGALMDTIALGLAILLVGWCQFRRTRESADVLLAAGE